MRNFCLIIAAAVLVGLLLGWYLGVYSANNVKWVDHITEVDKNAVEKPKEKEEVVKEGALPKVKTDNPIHDFGVLDKNAKTEKGEHDFVIENIGDAPLTLTEAGKGCMCTTFLISKATVKKGDKATVKVKWDASRGGGVFDQSVRVATNDPTNKELLFTVRGLYTSPVIANPNQILFTGITSGATATRDFKVFGFTKQDQNEKTFDLEITEATVSNPKHFDIKLEKTSLDQMSESETKHELFRKAANMYTGTITIKPGMPQGSFQEIARIRTNDPQIPVLEIMVEGQITGAYKVTGTRYDRLGSGHLAIGSISTKTTTVEKIRMTIIDSMIVTPETLKVGAVRPKWLDVRINYPSPELQKTLPVKMIDIEIVLSAGSPLGNFMGPAKDLLGEIVFLVGREPDKMTEVIVPVQFAVGP